MTVPDEMFSCCCDWGFEFIAPILRDDNTPWTGNGSTGNDKLFLQSGQFTSTIVTSENISAFGTTPTSVAWDGTNSPWSTIISNRLLLQSGQYTSTLKTSLAVARTSDGICWDGADSPWSSPTIPAKLLVQSGQFTSTIKTSLDVSAVDTQPRDISFSSGDTPWIGSEADKLYLQSGQFTSTLKTSESVSLIDNNTQGITWDGVNTPWCGNTAPAKLYLQSGQFTSTLKTSLAIITGFGLTGINTNLLTVG